MKEVNFLDRVPTYPGRVVLTPVSGQANTFDMSRADSPRVAGTPLDKATFDSVVHSRLTGRYYEPGHTLTQLSFLTGLTTNPIPASGWIVTDGVATNGGYIATTKDGDADVVEVFDTSDNTGISAIGVTEYWVQLELPQAITVKKVRTYVYTTTTAATLTTLVQGSNDGNSWDTLATISGNQSATTEVTLSKTGEYKYYRLYLSSTSTGVRVYSFGFSSYDINTYSMAYAAPEGWPTAWTKGQRVTVHIPSDAKTGAVVSNTVAGIPCATILRVGRRYELRYDGSAFVAKEV